MAEFLAPLQLHPLVLDGCLGPTAGSRVAPYVQSLPIKLPIQTGWDCPDHILLSVICLHQAIITIHGETVSVLENVAKDFFPAVCFHTLSTSDILYQILDRLIDEDMALVVKARGPTSSISHHRSLKRNWARPDTSRTKEKIISPRNCNISGAP